MNGPAEPRGRRTLAAAWLAALLEAATPVSGKDLGVWGEVWPIEEADLLTRIEARLADLERSGELARMNEEARARARRRIEAPAPVPGIAPAVEPRSWLHDPAVVVERDVVGPDGLLIAPAGLRIEPLAHRPLTRTLLFVDGGRPDEVGWALAHTAPTRIVLLAGRPLDLAREHGRAFYFDQGGALSRTFAIRATPARVRQEGLKLRVEEVPLRGPARGGGDEGGNAPAIRGRESNGEERR